MSSLGELVLDHGVGTVRITRAGLLGPALAAAAGLPRVSRCRTEFSVVRDSASHTTWRRRYDTGGRPRRCDTAVRATPDGFDERRGPLTMRWRFVGPRRALLAGIRCFGIPVAARGGISAGVTAAAVPGGLVVTVDLRAAGGRIGRVRYVAELTRVAS